MSQNENVIGNIHIIRRIKSLEEEARTTKQVISVFINFAIYWFGFYAFDVINSWAWFGFHMGNPIIDQFMLLKQATLWSFTLVVAIFLGVLWWERAVAPIYDDAKEGARRIGIWFDGAISGGRSALKEEL